MITTFSAIEPNMVDKMVKDFDQNGESFWDWLVHHLKSEDHYVFKGPNYFMMAWADHEKRAWVVFYAYARNGYPLIGFVNKMPYYLPKIAFMRGMRGKKDLKYYPTERLKKLCEISAS